MDFYSDLMFTRVRLTGYDLIAIYILLRAPSGEARLYIYS